MLIKILAIILGMFFVLAFNSFFITLFSFSVFIIVVFILMDKIDWRKWIVIIAILSILMDIMLHRALGVTLLSISISVVSLYLLFILMPRKKFVLSYLPYFLSIFVFYILLSLLNPLIQNGSFEVLTWGFIIFSIIKSLISAILIWVINIIMDNFRSNKDLLI